MVSSLSSSARRKKSRSQSQSLLNKWSIQNKYTLFILSIIGIFSAIAATALFNIYIDRMKQLKTREMNWKEDKTFLESLEKQMTMESLYNCDLPIYDLKLRPDDIHLINDKTLEFPFLLRNSIDHWKAFERWTKTNFSSLYGDQIVYIGTESSIVYGGGSTVTPISIKEYLQHMNEMNDIYQSIDSLSSSLSPLSSFLSSTFSFLSTLSSSSSSSSPSPSSSNSGTSSSSTKSKISSSKSPSLPMDSFVFDVSILNSKYTLKNDFRIPRYFLPWDNPDTYQNGTVYHMLSLGSSRTGLPFHYHGHTWLGLVYGSKLWLMYPPGLSPPERLEREYNPLQSVQQWIRDIYPRLLEFPRPWRFVRDDKTGVYEPTNPEETGPPVFSSSTTDSSVTGDNSTVNISATPSSSSSSSSSSLSGQKKSFSASARAAAYYPNEIGGDYRPLQCLQRSGDLLYLPAGWLHMTINIGEAIGIGGQALLSAKHRYELSLSTLDLYPESFDALKGVGIAAAHMAMEVTDTLKEYAKPLTITKYIIKLKTHAQFIQMIDQSEDIWLILFYTHISGDIHQMQMTWQAVAARLQGLICVGIFDMTLVSDEESEIIYGVNKSGLDRQTEVRLYVGGSRPMNVLRNYTQLITATTAATAVQENDNNGHNDNHYNNNNNATTISAPLVGTNTTTTTTAATAPVTNTNTTTAVITAATPRYVSKNELSRLGVGSLFELTAEVVGELGNRLFQYGIRYDNSPPPLSPPLSILAIEENELKGIDKDNNNNNSTNVNMIDDSTTTTTTTTTAATTPSSAAANIKTPSMAESISDFALDLLMNPHLRLQHGCIASVTAKARRLFKISERHLRRALDHRPLHPEVRGALAEVLGHAGESAEMRRIIDETVQLFELYTHIDRQSKPDDDGHRNTNNDDNNNNNNDDDDDVVDEYNHDNQNRITTEATVNTAGAAGRGRGRGGARRSRNHYNPKNHPRGHSTVNTAGGFTDRGSSQVSSASLASLYHRLGTIFLTQKSDDVKDSLPLFLKSLTIDPLFIPALADSARVHLHLNHSSEAAETIATLTSVAPTHPHLNSLKKKLQHLLEIKKLG